MEVKGKDDRIVSVGVISASGQFKPQEKKTLLPVALLSANRQ